MRYALLFLLCACSHPALYDATVDAGADAFTCPDGAVCATAPDGGCDPNRWQTSCGPGLVCASDGTCGVACGNSNTVCDPSTVCDNTSDCVPPCLAGDGSRIIVKPRTTCLAAGLLEPADSTQPCIVPCYFALCGFLGGGC
jgi:hypothetical protein